MPKLKKSNRSTRKTSTKTKKVKKTHLVSKWNRVRMTFLFVTLYLFGIISGAIAVGYYIKAAYADFHPYVPSEIIQVSEEVKPNQITHNELYQPIKIKIGTLIDLSIESQVYKDGTWTIPEKSAAHLVNSAYPFEPNNIIVYGHNTWHVFGKLKQVTKADIIALVLANGSTREYEITEIIEITPDKTEYLQPTSEETLTIYTCSGWMDSKRLIIRAKPKVL